MYLTDMQENKTPTHVPLESILIANAEPITSCSCNNTIEVNTLMGMKTEASLKFKLWSTRLTTY